MEVEEKTRHIFDKIYLHSPSKKRKREKKIKKSTKGVRF